MPAIIWSGWGERWPTGTEGFYAKLGFDRMNTAMAIWRNRASAIASGLISEVQSAPSPDRPA
jgi:hypothetical protein